MLASKEVKLSFENRPKNNPPPILVWDGESIVETTAYDEKSLVNWLLKESKPYEVYLGQDADNSSISPDVHSIQHRMKSLIGKQRGRVNSTFLLPFHQRLTKTKGNELVLLVSVNNNHSLHKRTKKFIAKEIPILLAQNAEFQVYEKDGKMWEESPSPIGRRASVRISTRNHNKTIHDGEELRSPSSSRSGSRTPTNRRQLRSAGSSNMSVISSTSSLKYVSSKKQRVANVEKLNHVDETRNGKVAIQEPSGDSSPNGIIPKSATLIEEEEETHEEEGKDDDSKKNSKMQRKPSRNKSKKTSGVLHSTSSEKVKHEQLEEEEELLEKKKSNTVVKNRRRSVNIIETENTTGHRTRRQSARESSVNPSPLSSPRSPRESQKNFFEESSNEESGVNKRISLRGKKESSPSSSSLGTSRYPRRSQKVNYAMESSGTDAEEEEEEEEEVLPTLKSRRFFKRFGVRYIFS